MSGRGRLTGVPHRIAVDGNPPRRVLGWAGPWPVEERWWAPAEASRRVRFQVRLADGRAYLLVLEAGAWTIRGEYD